MPCSKEGLWCTALDKALSADRGNTFPLLSTAESKGQVWACWYETEMHGLPKQLRDCNISAMRKGWQKQECSAYSRKGSEVISRIHLNSCYEGIMQMELDSFHRRPTTGPEVMGTNWNMGCYFWTSGITLLAVEVTEHWHRLPGRLQCYLKGWSCWKAIWTRSWLNGCMGALDQITFRDSFLLNSSSL